MIPNHITPVPVPIDGQGMKSDALRALLSGWDAAERGMDR